MSLFQSIFSDLILIYASGSKFFRLGPATKPTKPKRTKEPIPKPAAHGLKPPDANEANKFINLNSYIFVIAYRIFERNIPILRHFFVIGRIFKIYISFYKLNKYFFSPADF